MLLVSQDSGGCMSPSQWTQKRITLSAAPCIYTQYIYTHDTASALKAETTSRQEPSKVRDLPDGEKKE